MFKWFKKNKTVKVLLVVNSDVHEPIDYKNKIDVDLKTEVRAACYSVGIEHDEKMLNDIVEKLEAGETYYIECTPFSYGFEVIEIKL